MVANKFWQNTVWLACLLAVLLALGFGTGCGEGNVTAPPSGRAQISIEDGPDKPATRIQITLDSPMAVSLEILDANSGLVRLLFSDFLAAGQHAVVWDGRDDEDVTVASGPYWAVLSSAQGFEANAMMMIK